MVKLDLTISPGIMLIITAMNDEERWIEASITMDTERKNLRFTVPQYYNYLKSTDNTRRKRKRNSSM